MKILKKIGIGILVIIALILLLAAFVPKDFNYEKSMIIDAPVERVWKHTSTLKAMEVWSPWENYDPNMKKELTGIDGTIGAKSEWDSDHEKVGKGSQTITKIEAPNIIETDLKFYTPYESEAEGFIRLVAEGSGTKITWGFKSQMPYPFNLMKLTMNMDEAIGNDFQYGLNQLKKLCEEN